MEVTKNPERWPECCGYDNKKSKSAAGIHITAPSPKSEKAGHLNDSFSPVSKEFQESRSSQRPTFRSTLRDLTVHRLMAS